MPLTAQQGAELVRYARASIAHALGGPQAQGLRDGFADRPGAVFVTLRRKDGALHGCVGSLEARRSLAEDVRENAIASALDDPRAPAIELEDLSDLDVEISVLSPLEKLAWSDASDALAKLAGLREGVVLRYGFKRATFLPQMWDRFPDAEEFVRQLKMKAGLDEEAWPEGLEIWHYKVQKIHE